jgi:hypothetical protein
MEAESRLSHYYVTYRADDLSPISIGTAKPEILPNGVKLAVVDFQIGNDFINFRKYMHDYCVIVDNGIAEFRPINVLTHSRRLKNTGNIILDLNPSNPFFEILGIVYTYQNNKIKLFLDIDDIDLDIKLFFKNMIAENQKFPLFITAYGDPTQLLVSTEFNLYSLIKDKQLEIEVETGLTKVSLWAIK